MKKILLFLSLLLFPFFISYVGAETVGITMNGPNNIDAGSNFDVMLSMSGTDILGAQMDFIYDRDKLELLSYEGKNSFAATIDDRIILDSSQSHNNTFDVVVLHFKVKSSFVAGQSTTIRVSNVLATNSNYDDITSSGTSKTITVNIPKSSDNKLSDLKINGTTISGFSANTTEYNYSTEDASISVSATSSDSKANVSGTGTKNLNYGSNNITVTVTAENGSTRNYKINVNRKDNRSTDNYLSSLEVKGANIKFNKNTLNYSVNVENNVSSVEIVAKASDSKSKVEGAGTKKLEVYANSFTVSVTAENGQVRNYVIKINRKDEKGNLGALSKNNKLKELSVEGYNIEFNKDINEYQLEVDNTVETIKVNAVVDDAKATMELDNPTKLKVGKNQIKIKVVSESGEENTYVINVVRKDNMPVTTIAEVEEVLSKMTASKLEIEIKDDNSVLNKSLISKLKEKEIEVTIKKYDNNKVIYIWNINSKNFENDFEFNSEIKFDSEKQDVIDKLTNYSNSFYLDFTHSGVLPKGTTLTIYVGSKYIDGDRINLYYYNELENKIELINKELVVKNNGYVTFDIKHCSNYILSKATIGGKVISNDNKFNISFIIAIIEGIVIGGLLLFIGYKIGLFNKLKKNKVVEEGQATKESINDTKFEEFFTSNDTISNNSVNLDNNSNIVDNSNVINSDNNIFNNNNAINPDNNIFDNNIFK